MRSSNNIDSLIVPHCLIILFSLVSSPPPDQKKKKGDKNQSVKTLAFWLSSPLLPVKCATPTLPGAIFTNNQELYHTSAPSSLDLCVIPTPSYSASLPYYFILIGFLSPLCFKKKKRKEEKFKKSKRKDTGLLTLFFTSASEVYSTYHTQCYIHPQPRTLPYLWNTASISPDLCAFDYKPFLVDTSNAVLVTYFASCSF